jgi:hypothetical protein
MESIKKQESSKDVMFKKELLALFGTNDLEDVQHAQVTLSLLGVREEVKNQDAEEQISSTLFRPNEDKRCQLCHQPIQNIVELRSETVLAFIGVDCASKLRNFIVSGKVEAVNVSQKASNFNNDVIDIISPERKDLPGFKKSTTVASMLTWLDWYIAENQDSVPDNIKRIFDEVSIFGFVALADDAKTLANWYMSTRTFIVNDVVTRDDSEALESHPHASMLQKLLSQERSGVDVQRFLRILHAYRERIGASFKYLSELVSDGFIVEIDKDAKRRSFISEDKIGFFRTKYSSLFGEDRDFTRSSFYKKEGKDGKMHVYSYDPVDSFVFEKEGKVLQYSQIPQWVSPSITYILPLLSTATV